MLAAPLQPKRDSGLSRQSCPVTRSNAKDAWKSMYDKSLRRQTPTDGEELFPGLAKNLSKRFNPGFRNAPKQVNIDMSKVPCGLQIAANDSCSYGSLSKKASGPIQIITQTSGSKVRQPTHSGTKRGPYKKAAKIGRSSLCSNAGKQKMERAKNNSGKMPAVQVRQKT